MTASGEYEAIKKRGARASYQAPGVDRASGHRSRPLQTQRGRTIPLLLFGGIARRSRPWIGQKGNGDGLDSRARPETSVLTPTKPNIHQQARRKIKANATMKRARPKADPPYAEFWSERQNRSPESKDKGARIESDPYS